MRQLRPSGKRGALRVICFANNSYRLPIARGHRQRSGSVGDAGGRAPDQLALLVRAVGRPRSQRGILSRASWLCTAIVVPPPSLRQAWARSHR